MFRNDLIWRHVIEASIWWHYQVFFSKLDIWRWVCRNTSEGVTCQAASEWHFPCSKVWSSFWQPLVLGNNFIFFKTSALWRYQVIWRLGDGFHKPLEGVTLPSRVSHELWKRYLHLNNHLFTKQYRTIITWNRFFLEGISLEKLVQGLLSHCLGRKKGHRWGPKNEHLVAGTRSGAYVPLSGQKTP